jgi:HEAT repeat protein
MSECDQTEYEDKFRNDPRTNEELISAALLRTHDEDSYWDAVLTLQRRDTSEVLGRAQELCQSPQSVERRLGADILAQLGVPERTFLKQCVATLLEMLKEEKDVDVLQAVLIALGHLGQPEAIEPASRFRTHPDPGVRHGVVFALMGHEYQLAVECLIELSKDSDAHNRDWATFGLGTQIDLDIPAIREALLERVADEDFDTRCEAIVGLARRRDRRVIPAVIQVLTSDMVGTLAVEAEATIAAAELRHYLVTLQSWSDIDKDLLNEAIQACTPSSDRQ